MVRIKDEDGIGADCSPSRKRSRVSPAAAKSGIHVLPSLRSRL